MREIVQDYYGNVLQSSGDLKSDACCDLAAPSDTVRDALADIHPEIANRYYGCGLVAPENIEGARILDLGCGTGRDAFLLARLAGETGEVVGVDMTPAQLAFAREYEDWHAERYGYAKPNTRFLEAYIEELDALDLEPGSFDLVISNCVINLSTDKPAVFQGARRLLKPGGSMYFADVYAERPVPEALRTDPVLYGECLAGALSWDDFLTIAAESGFGAPALIDHRPLAITDKALEEKLNGLKFVSATVSLTASKKNDVESWDDALRDPFARKTNLGHACC